MNKLNINSKIVLNNKTEIPVIGLGVFRIPDGEETVNAVKWALAVGYRMIDAAMIYKNELGVGKAIRESGIPREEIFVTTKLWNTDQGYESALKAIDVSLQKLGITYVDLYLIHWPTAGDASKGESVNKREETWKAMEEIYRLGKAKAIGVSNYMINHLEEMKKYRELHQEDIKAYKKQYAEKNKEQI
ncbi:MAG: aldo/keto reductase, partial [bacterium]